MTNSKRKSSRISNNSISDEKEKIIKDLKNTEKEYKEFKKGYKIFQKSMKEFEQCIRNDVTKENLLEMRELFDNYKQLQYDKTNNAILTIMRENNWRDDIFESKLNWSINNSRKLNNRQNQIKEDSYSYKDSLEKFWCILK